MAEFMNRVTKGGFQPVYFGGFVHLFHGTAERTLLGVLPEDASAPLDDAALTNDAVLTSALDGAGD